MYFQVQFWGFIQTVNSITLATRTILNHFAPLYQTLVEIFNYFPENDRTRRNITRSPRPFWERWSRLDSTRRRTKSDSTCREVNDFISNRHVCTSFRENLSWTPYYSSENTEESWVWTLAHPSSFGTMRTTTSCVSTKFLRKIRCQKRSQTSWRSSDPLPPLSVLGCPRSVLK